MKNIRTDTRLVFAYPWHIYNISISQVLIFHGLSWLHTHISCHIHICAPWWLLCPRYIFFHLPSFKCFTSKPDKLSPRSSFSALLSSYVPLALLQALKSYISSRKRERGSCLQYWERENVILICLFFFCIIFLLPTNYLKLQSCRRNCM